MRLGYASYLSSWALLNSGTAESNYGYWYPGENNDGGASGGFEPRPWGRAWLGNKEMGRGPWWYSGEIDLGFGGALRTAATVIVDDPIFGLLSYGGDIKREKTITEVVPKDGLRTRFHVLRGSQRLHLLLERDGFAERQPVSFDEALATIKLRIEIAGTFHKKRPSWSLAYPQGRIRSPRKICQSKRLLAVTAKSSSFESGWTQAVRT
jgi:hypothetical protein